MRARLDPARLLPQLAAPVAALIIAAAISSVVLAVGGKPIVPAFQSMANYGTLPRSLVLELNKATDYYLAAVAVAIGFRMALFNIGVDGQYRLAALLAAALGGASFVRWLPGPLITVLVVLVAMAVGAAWASIAALLKVYRGVSEVISTIMLNFVAGSLVAYLLTTDKLAVQPKGGQSVSTAQLPQSSWIPSLPLIPGTTDGVYGFIIVAIAVGIAYWYLLGRTRFGFDLRATGLNPSAAVASGVNARGMVIRAMLLSGAVAGLVGMSQVLGAIHAFSEDVGGLGFTGIAVALLGRNHPVGIAFAAMLWAFLDNSAQILALQEIPKETVSIMQGTTVLAVVVAYELAGRLSRRVQQRRVGEVTGQAAPPPEVSPAGPAPASPAPSGTAASGSGPIGTGGPTSGGRTSGASGEDRT
jgi:general nucleoside transport system permease protein